MEKTHAGEGESRPAVPKEFGDLSHGGLSVELWCRLETGEPGRTLFSTQEKDGRGVRVVTSEAGGELSLTIELCDGARVAAWQTDPGALRVGVAQHVVFSCDFSAAVIAVVANGVFLDGGASRQYGWGRIPLDMGEPKGAFHARVSPAVSTVRLYGRPLRTSEAVSNYRAGEPK
jgi:hypothetical protein